MLTQSQKDFEVDLPDETYIGLWERNKVIVPLEEGDYVIPVQRSCLAENEEESIKVKVIVERGLAYIESCHPKLYYQF